MKYQQINVSTYFFWPIVQHFLTFSCLLAGGNQLKEPPIKTNEPGPYFGFGVNQSSQPMVSAQYTACQFILILVLHLWQAIWH